MDHMKLAVLSLMLVLVVLTGFSTSAGASSSSRLGRERAGSFCRAARSVARDIVNSTAIANGHVVPANIKVVYEKIAAAEPALLSSASKPIKSDLRPVFGFVNLLIADFKKVNWNPAGLASYMPTLIARARAIQKPLHALQVYFKGTCKLNV
jgi:hypothetical protein